MTTHAAGAAEVHGLNGASLTPELAERLSLCEALDRILNKGAVVAGEVVISVADVDLLYLELRLLLSSVETLRQRHGARDDTGRGS